MFDFDSTKDGTGANAIFFKDSPDKLRGIYVPKFSILFTSILLISVVKHEMERFDRDISLEKNVLHQNTDTKTESNSIVVNSTQII